MRRALPLLLLLLLSRGEAGDSPDLLARFLAACERLGTEAPSTARASAVFTSWAGESADTEGTFDGPLRILPTHAYLRMQASDYVEGARRIEGGWAFRRITTRQKGDKAKPERDEMDAWRRGKAVVRTKGRGYESSGDEILLEPAELLKGLVGQEKGKPAFKVRNGEKGWKADGDRLVWASEDPKALEELALSPTTRRWLRDLRKLPEGTGASARGSLEAVLDPAGRIVKLVRKVEISLPCRDSRLPQRQQGCQGCAMDSGETLEGSWGYEPGEHPEVPAEVRKRLGLEGKAP